MATITSNAMIDGMSGKFGDSFIFRTMRGKTFVSPLPRKPNKKKESEAQRNTRTTFRKAAEWAQCILLNPEKKAYYMQRAKKLDLPNAYTAAITDYMRKPKVTKLQTRDGVTYCIHKKGFRVKEVKVEMTDGLAVPPNIVVRQVNSEWYVDYNLVDAAPPAITLRITDNARRETLFEEMMNSK